MRFLDGQTYKDTQGREWSKGDRGYEYIDIGFGPIRLNAKVLSSHITGKLYVLVTCEGEEDHIEEMDIFNTRFIKE